MEIQAEETVILLPEPIIEQWQFLSDYYDFIKSTSASDNKTRWTYTPPDELKKWLCLAEEMTTSPVMPGVLRISGTPRIKAGTSVSMPFHITRRRHSGYTHPVEKAVMLRETIVDNDVAYLPSLSVIDWGQGTALYSQSVEGILSTPVISILREDWNWTSRHLHPLFKLSEMIKTINFMSPIDSSYLLYVDIDEGLSVEERMKYYQELGTHCCKSYIATAPIASCHITGNEHDEMNNYSRLVGFILNGEVKKIWTDIKPELKDAIETLPTDQVASILQHSPVTTFIGIVRSIYQRMIADTSNNAREESLYVDSLVGRGWSDMRQFLTDENNYTLLRGTLQKLDELESVVLAEGRECSRAFSMYVWSARLFPTYILEDVMRDGICFQLLSGVPIKSISNGALPAVLPPLRTAEILFPIKTLQTSSHETLLTMIVHQVKTCSNSSIAMVARYLLGLGPLLYTSERSSSLLLYAADYPFYYRFYFGIMAVGWHAESHREKVQLLKKKYGLQYLEAVAEVLIRLIEHSATLDIHTPDVFLFTIPERHHNPPPPHRDEELRAFVSAVLEEM